MKVEIKKDGEKFEEFDKNMKRYKVVFWRKGLTTLRDIAYEPFFFNHK